VDTGKEILRDYIKATIGFAKLRIEHHALPAGAVLTGILFVLRTGIRWEMLPAEMDCGSGVTCRRRLRDWLAADVWDRLQVELLRRLRDADGRTEHLPYARTAERSPAAR
jgi:transposase